MVAKSTGCVNCVKAHNPSSYKFKFQAHLSVNIISCQQMQGQIYGRVTIVLWTADTSKHEELRTLSIYYYYLSLALEDLEHTQITPRRLRVKWRTPKVESST